MRAPRPGDHQFVNPGFSGKDNRVLAPGPKGSPDDMLVSHGWRRHPDATQCILCGRAAGDVWADPVAFYARAGGPQVIYYGNVFVGPDGLLWMYYLAQVGRGRTVASHRASPA